MPRFPANTKGDIGMGFNYDVSLGMSGPPISDTKEGLVSGKI
jgi:hypothetical protein